MSKTQPRVPENTPGFHRMDQFEKRETLAANTRVFVGDGTPYLRCPGLLLAQAVRVGITDLPATITRSFPVKGDITLQTQETVTMPGWTVKHAVDGCPVLLRNIVSNDGIWQDACYIYVTGEWDESVPPVELPAEESLKKRRGLK